MKPLMTRESEGDFEYGNYLKEAEDLHAVTQYFQRDIKFVLFLDTTKDLIDMDQQDERSGRKEEIHQQLLTLYRQHPPSTDDSELIEKDESGSEEGSNSNSCQEFKAF